MKLRDVTVTCIAIALIFYVILGIAITARAFGHITELSSEDWIARVAAFECIALIFVVIALVYESIARAFEVPK